MNFANDIEYFAITTVAKICRPSDFLPCSLDFVDFGNPCPSDWCQTAFSDRPTWSFSSRFGRKSRKSKTEAWEFWGNNTVDGSEIRRSPVEVGSLSHYLQGFYKGMLEEEWVLDNLFAVEHRIEIRKF